MTKVFKVPFERFGKEIVTYKIRVTDNMEERDSWKRAEAINTACARFSKEYVGFPGRYVRLDKVKEC